MRFREISALCWWRSQCNGGGKKSQFLFSLGGNGDFLSIEDVVTRSGHHVVMSVATLGTSVSSGPPCSAGRDRLLMCFNCKVHFLPQKNTMLTHPFQDPPVWRAKGMHGLCSVIQQGERGKKRCRMGITRVQREVMERGRGLSS